MGGEGESFQGFWCPIYRLQCGETKAKGHKESVREAGNEFHFLSAILVESCRSCQLLYAAWRRWWCQDNKGRQG
jgi:hypothetical protein